MEKQFKKLACISYNKLWEQELDNIVSIGDKLQDLIINQLKIDVHDTYKKDEKITTDFEAINNEDVINKSYLDEKLSELKGQLSLLETDYNGFKLQYNKQSVEGSLFQRAVKTTIQLFHDKRFFDNLQNADKVSKIFCL